MKNVQIIDSAENCSYSICLVDDEDFAVIFPQPGQDVEFIEDLVTRVGKKVASQLVLRGTTRRIHKQNVNGIHGTLFFGFPGRRKYFPTKRELDIKHPDFIP